jgi:hypothetical protein
VAGSCEYCDEPSGSGAAELVGYLNNIDCFLFAVETDCVFCEVGTEFETNI